MIKFKDDYVCGLIAMKITATENVIQKVIGEVKEEIKVVLDEGLNNAVESIEKVKVELLSEIENILNSKDKQIEIIRKRTLGSAEMDARNQSLNEVETATNKVFSETLENMKTIVKSDRYKKSFKIFVEEALSIIGNTDVLITSNKRDAILLKSSINQIAAERNLKIAIIKEPIECIGGVQVKSHDESIFYDNTIEARLERLRPTLRKDIAALFLGKV